MKDKDILKLLKNGGNIMDKKIENKKFSKEVVVETTSKNKVKSKKPIWAVAVSLVLVMALVIGGIGLIGGNGTTAGSDFYMSISINPNVAMTGENGVVTSIQGINADGVIVARAIKDQIVGKTPEEATKIFVNATKDKGYIGDTLPNKEIVVNVTANDNKTENLVKDAIVSEAEKFLTENNIQGNVVAPGIETTPDVKALADKYNVTVGKMNFILKAQEKFPEMTLEELSVMDVDDINKLAEEFDEAKLDALEEELDVLEDAYESELEAKEKLIEEKYETLEKEFNTILDQLSGDGTVDIEKVKAEIAALKLTYPELTIDESKLTLENYEEFGESVEEEIENIAELQEEELEKMEEEFEDELEKREDALKDELGLKDDDDDDEDDDDDDEDKDDDKDDKDEDKDDDKDDKDEDGDKDDKDDKDEDKDTDKDTDSTDGKDEDADND